jgi:hypothetical protein
VSAQEKRAVFERLLAQGPVLAQLDARMFGVRVPEEHRQDYALRLRFGRGVGPQDLRVSDWGVRETLWPGFECAVPWGAIYLLASEEEVVGFPDDLPMEVSEEAHRRAMKALVDLSRDRAGAVLNGPTEEPPASKPTRPGLRLVHRGEGEP